MPTQLSNGRIWYSPEECGVYGGAYYDPGTDSYYAPKLKATCKNGQWRSNALFGAVATPGEAQDARMTVEELKTYYPKLPTSVQAKYKTQYDSIIKSWNEYDSAWVFYTFDQAVTVGRKARELLLQLSRESPSVVPAEALSKTNVGGVRLDDLAPDLSKVALLAVLVGGAFAFMKKG